MLAKASAGQASRSDFHADDRSRRARVIHRLARGPCHSWRLREEGAGVRLRPSEGGAASADVGRLQADPDRTGRDGARVCRALRHEDRSAGAVASARRALRCFSPVGPRARDHRLRSGDAAGRAEGRAGAGGGFDHPAQRAKGRGTQRAARTARRRARCQPGGYLRAENVGAQLDERLLPRRRHRCRNPQARQLDHGGGKDDGAGGSQAVRQPVVNAYRSAAQVHAGQGRNDDGARAAQARPDGAVGRAEPRALGRFRNRAVQPGRAARGGDLRTGVAQHAGRHDRVADDRSGHAAGVHCALVRPLQGELSRHQPASPEVLVPRASGSCSRRSYMATSAPSES